MYHRTCMARLFMIIDHNFHAMIVVIIYEVLVFRDEIFIHTFFMTPITDMGRLRSDLGPTKRENTQTNKLLE